MKIYFSRSIAFEAQKLYVGKIPGDYLASQL